MNPISDFKIKTFVVGYIQTNMYLVVNNFQGIIIDPGFIATEAEALIKKVAKESPEIPAVFLTHGHYDHISGCNAVREKFQSKIYCHRLDQDKLLNGERSGALLFPAGENPSFEGVEYLEGGEVIKLINLSFEIICTPGHTSGGVSIFMENKFLFSGDTIFKDAIGRTDLYDGSYESEISSIKNKIFSLPSDTIIYPGHGPKTTVGQEKKYFNY